MAWPSKKNFDIVSSRDMLIYFDNESKVAAMKRFAEVLKTDGKLFLGHADIVPKNQWFTKHSFGVYTLFKSN